MLDRGSIAILLFSFSPERSAREKTWLRNRGKNIELHQRVHKRIKCLARRAGVDFFHIDEGQQLGRDFQDRLWNAVEHVFNQGYRAVLTLGGDTPTLTHIILQRSLNQLQCEHNVLGPSRDGGTYLIGFQRAWFLNIRHHQIQWHAGTDFDQLLSLLTQEEVWIAPVLSDWDTFTDIQYQLCQQPAFWLWRVIISDLLISSCEITFVRSVYRKVQNLVFGLGMRAPPLRQLF